MKATSVWMGGYENILDDGRGHSVTVDLPTKDDGENKGPTALELCIMSMAGCISTIFRTIADKRRFVYKAFKVELEAEKGAVTVTNVKGRMEVVTEADEKEAQTVLRLTLNTCPVGVIFNKAGIKLDYELTVKKPT
jgi:uncharacterized OsmC-like protein